MMDQVQSVVVELVSAMEKLTYEIANMRARVGTLELRLNDLDAELLLSSKRTHPS